MKITHEHVAHIRKAILADNTAPTWPSYQARGLSAKRWRWDRLYRAGLSLWICDSVYPYANDEHIDTVLRNIFPEVPA
jgi:hypothetical protein